jgi:hypothetical protein
MVRPRKTYFLILILLISLTGAGKSQTTSSPYSIFGLGSLESSSTGPFEAMGGTGIAYLSDRSINYMNPASYSGLDSLMSVFETGVFGKYTLFSTSRESQSLVNSNLKYVMMGFRITPWLATSFGFTPYSSIGYNINVQAPLVGSIQDYMKTYTGEGGVNQVYLGGSVRLLKNLSVGFNAAYLFGNITHSESSTVYPYYLEDATYVSNFDFNYGLNYMLKIQKLNFNLGLIYGSAKNLKTKNITTIQTENETEILKSRMYKYSIPENIGAGLAVRKDFFSAGFDYEWSRWKDVKFTNNDYLQTRNSNRYSFGVELPSQGVNKGTARMWFYRVGAEYRESYLIIDKIPLDYKAITMGVGIPLKGVISVINASLEIGQNGTTKGGLFRENFIILNLDLSLRDLWFMQRRYN